MQETSHFIWDVSPVMLDLGFYQIRWYGLLFALSFVFAYYIMQAFFKKGGKPLEHMDSLALFMMLSTIIGARLGHVFFYNFVNGEPITLMGILEIWKGGLASHGAAIGLLVSMYLFTRKYKYSFLWLADRIVVTVALAALFIRIGNFFNSEILGTVTDVPWAVIFPYAHNSDMLPHHPAQLYEGFFYFLVFLLLFKLIHKNIAAPKHANGFFLGLFMVLVFTYRFIIEFYKETQVGVEEGFTLLIGQWLSIPFVIAGIILVAKTFNKASGNQNKINS